VAGVLGLLLMITGLTLAMVETIDPSNLQADLGPLTKAFFTVIISLVLALVGSMYLGQRLFTTNRFGHFALDTVQDKEEGFTSAGFDFQVLIHQKGVAETMLRPSGKIRLGEELYDATIINGYADKGEEVEVMSYQTGQLFVRKVS
jgi:membrane-bound serine protease (ClpP class)